MSNGANFMSNHGFLHQQSAFESRYGQSDFAHRRNDSDDELEENDEEDDNENEKTRSRSRSRSSTSSPTRQYSAKRQKCEPVSPKPMSAPNMPFMYNQYTIPNQHFNPFAHFEQQKYFPFPGIVPNFAANSSPLSDPKPTKSQTSKPKCSFDIESLIENKHDDSTRTENQTALSTSSSDLSSNSSCTNSPFKSSADMNLLMASNQPAFPSFSPEAFYLLVAKYQNIISAQNQTHNEPTKLFSPNSHTTKKEIDSKEYDEELAQSDDDEQHDEPCADDSKVNDDCQETKNDLDDKELNVDDDQIENESSFHKIESDENQI